MLQSAMEILPQFAIETPQQFAIEARGSQVPVGGFVALDERKVLIAPSALSVPRIAQQAHPTRRAVSTGDRASPTARAWSRRSGPWSRPRQNQQLFRCMFDWARTLALWTVTSTQGSAAASQGRNTRERPMVASL